MDPVSQPQTLQPQPAPVPPQITTMPKPAGGSQRALGVLLIVVLLAGAGYWAWRAGYVAEFGKFFAAEPEATPEGVPAVGDAVPLVKLYPVISDGAHTVSFVLEPGNVEVTAFQLEAVIQGGFFGEAETLTGSDPFSQILEPAQLEHGGATVRYTAGIAAGKPGVTYVAVIAGIPFSVAENAGKEEVCISVNLLHSIVTAKGLDDNQIDTDLIGWSNEACLPVAQTTTTPGATVTGQPTVSATPSVPPSEGRRKPGDADRDGDVDIFDFNTVVAQFGQTGQNLQGDVDDSGTVDIFDFNLVVEGFESKI